ncbi:hypothetical protein [Microbacterium sp. IEGM 1404]|uniref:hypothetical protein n=1 Tax=Microbacterium sp. IEGM 1404 TaxID=3047084 RepID=UPI0024B71BF9|nr:hypothetical protein [Microbacterium sp. IEGM 1404]MDI9889976.1 hypothetical protein [Microbacterium sp. IEGM 1404]
MIAVARLIRDHRGPVARTLRETFGVGISDLGGGLTWGEAHTLLVEAASDTGTALGAELAGWAYPANLRELITMIATIGDRKASQKVMPWVMKNPRGAVSNASAAEIAEAQAELEDDIVFS